MPPTPGGLVLQVVHYPTDELIWNSDLFSQHDKHWEALHTSVLLITQCQRSPFLFLLQVLLQTGGARDGLINPLVRAQPSVPTGLCRSYNPAVRVQSEQPNLTIVSNASPERTSAQTKVYSLSSKVFVVLPQATGCQTHVGLEASFSLIGCPVGPDQYNHHIIAYK